MLLESTGSTAASEAWWLLTDLSHPHPVFYVIAGILLLISLLCCFGFCWIHRKHQTTKRILQHHQIDQKNKRHLSVPSSHLTLPSTSPMSPDGDSFVISPFAAVNKYSTDSARTSFLNTASPRSYRAKSTYSTGSGIGSGIGIVESEMADTVGSEAQVHNLRIPSLILGVYCTHCP